MAAKKSNLAEMMGQKTVKIATSREMWNPNKTKLPVIGYLIGCERMAEDSDKPFDGLIIRLTKPTEVPMSKDKKDTRVREVPAGSDVIVVCTYALQSLKGMALQADSVYLVGIEPLEKTEIGDDKTMWQYNVETAEIKFKRADIAPETLSLVGGAPLAGELPAGA